MVLIAGYDKEVDANNSPREMQREMQATSPRENCKQLPKRGCKRLDGMSYLSSHELETCQG